MVSKFQDNPTVKDSEIVVLLRHVLLYAGKREGFGSEKKENEFGRKRECRNIS